MSDSFHMDPTEFRRHGHALVDWVADYMERVADLPVTPDVEPGDIGARLPLEPPEEPEPFEAILRDLDEIVMPGITHWQSPGWFAYFPANVSGPGILGELASAGLGVQGMLWATSPACTEVELRVVDWLVDLLGLPEHFKMAVGPGGGSIQVSASDSTHLMHVVARQRSAAPADRLVAYGSSQAHFSVQRGARVAGFRHIRSVATDERHALDPRALEAAIAADLADGLVPAIVTSAIGTTGTGAVDPIEAIGAIAGAHGVWHHVDAAWAGSARCCASSACIRPASSGWTRTRSIRTSGCSPTSTATCCGWPTALRSPPRSRTRRRSCAIPPRSRVRWWTCGTGSCRSAGASGRSSCGGCCAPTARAACATTWASTCASRASSPSA